MHQFCGDSAVHAPADSANDTTLWSTDFTDPSDFFPNEIFLHRWLAKLKEVPIMAYHSPVAPTPTYIQDESTDDLFTTRRMRDFRMELNSIEGFIIVRDGGIWSRMRVSNNMKFGRHLR